MFDHSQDRLKWVTDPTAFYPEILKEKAILVATFTRSALSRSQNKARQLSNSAHKSTKRRTPRLRWYRGYAALIGMENIV